ERQFVILLLVAGLPGVVIGGSVILMVPDRIAEIALGVLTGSLGIYSLFKPALGQLYTPLNRERHGYLIGAVVLFFLGILNGSLTSGTGLFVTIWLILWFGMD
ncbi:sulfite exporter TauE/SafE family protein, partial [Methylophaga sp. UBA4204]